MSQHNTAHHCSRNALTMRISTLLLCCLAGCIWVPGSELTEAFEGGDSDTDVDADTDVDVDMDTDVDTGDPGFAIDWFLACPEVNLEDSRPIQTDGDDWLDFPMPADLVEDGVYIVFNSPLPNPNTTQISVTRNSDNVQIEGVEIGRTERSIAMSFGEDANFEQWTSYTTDVSWDCEEEDNDDLGHLGPIWQTRGICAEINTNGFHPEHDAVINAPIVNELLVQFAYETTLDDETVPLPPPGDAELHLYEVVGTDADLVPLTNTGTDDFRLEASIDAPLKPDTTYRTEASWTCGNQSTRQEVTWETAVCADQAIETYPSSFTSIPSHSIFEITFDSTPPSPLRLVMDSMPLTTFDYETYGSLVRATPSEPLTATQSSTTPHELTWTWDCDSKRVPFNSDSTTGMAVSMVIGKAYELDLKQGTVLAPGPSLFTFFSDPLNLMLAITGHDGTYSALDLRIGSADASGVQDPCLPTVDLDDSPIPDWPYLEIEPSEPLPTNLGPIEGARIYGTMQSDQLAFEGLTLEGNLNTAPMALAGGHGADHICTLANPLGIPCHTCEGGLETCVEVLITNIPAPKLPADTEVIPIPGPNPCGGG